MTDWDTFSGWNIFGFLILLVSILLCYTGISELAKPTYDNEGELIDGGADLSMSGLCE